MQIIICTNEITRTKNVKKIKTKVRTFKKSWHKLCIHGWNMKNMTAMAKVRGFVTF